MKFTAWQIDKLVRGLHAYRVMKAANSHLLPWKTVLDHLLMSPATANSYPEDGGAPAFKEEALRRFATGMSTLEPDKLEDVRRLLVAAKVLKEEDLTESEDWTVEALTVHAALANSSEQAQVGLASLARGYGASRTNAGRGEDIELRLAPHTLNTMVVVEEHFRAKSSEGPTTMNDRKDRYCVANVHRKGYGFMMSDPGVLHLFVRSLPRDDLIHYVQVKAPSMTAVDSSILLLRSGKSSPPPAGDSPDHVLQRCNIIRFSTLDPQKVRDMRKKRLFVKA